MLLVLLLALQATQAPEARAPELFYAVTVPADRSAYLVEIQINNPPSPSRLVIPNWAPGAYRLMDSWQNIRDVGAVTAAGDPLPVRQDSPISGVVDGPRTFMYLDGWKQAPARVTFQMPRGWRVATGLVPTRSDSTIFQAPSYDVLIDSPALLGNFLTYSFSAAGTPHRAVVDLGGGR